MIAHHTNYNDQVSNVCKFIYGIKTQKALPTLPTLCNNNYREKVRSPLLFLLGYKIVKKNVKNSILRTIMI